MSDTCYRKNLAASRKLMVSLVSMQGIYLMVPRVGCRDAQRDGPTITSTSPVPGLCI